MIKKVLLGLFISLIGFTSFSYGARIVAGEPFVYNNNYFFVDNNANLSFAQDFDTTQYRLLYSNATYQSVNSQTAFFWHDNKLYYMLVKNNVIDKIGYLNYYCSDTFNGTNCYYCSSSDYGDCGTVGNASSVYNKLSTNFFNNNDKYNGKLTDIIVELRVANFYGDSLICFRYQDLDELVCFAGGYNNFSGLTPDNIFNTSGFDGINDIIGFKNYFQVSPFYYTSLPGTQASLSGTYIYKNCSVEVALLNFENTYGYNIGYCSGGNVVDGYYQFNTLKEYCSLLDSYVNSNNYGDIPYTGHNPNACLNVDSSWKVGTGKELSSVDWSNIIPSTVNGSGQYEEQNPTSFVVGLIDSLTSRYYFPEAGDFGLGYLPWYIIAGLMGVIFFRFISH